MGVVYFSIIPTFEPSRYCKCWIVCFYIYSGNILRDNLEELEMLITIDNIYYYFSGMMPREEYEKVLKNMNFF